MPADSTQTANTLSTAADVQAILSAAERLSGALTIRKEQITVLRSSCRELLKQTLSQNDVQDDHKEVGLPVESGIDRLRLACDTLKGVIDVLTQKGFLWCIVNAEKIENQVEVAEEKLLGSYEAFELDGTKVKSNLEAARTRDKEDMAHHLLYLAQDDDRLLRAIQDHGGVSRRLEELEVNIVKHVENIPIREYPTPEDRFLQAAEMMLRRRSARKSELKFPNYILSSLDVEHNPHQTVGSGASGQVYLGQWQSTLVAIKRMHPDEAKTISSDVRRKIYHEISIWTNLRHENILPLYGACPDADVPFIVMKYCPNGNVRHFLQTNTGADRFRLSCDVAVGLAFLHSKSIVHADIKGMNVLINGEQRALLTDFGLSIVMNEMRNLSTYSSDMQDKPRGTMAWMAPEVHRGSSPDKASDVYSLGMTIWEIYSEQNPFSGTKLEVLNSVVTSGARPDRPAKLLNEHKVWGVIKRCWADRPKARPSSSQVVDFMNLTNTDAIPTRDLDGIDTGVLAPASPVKESWNWISGMTAVNSISSGTYSSKRLPWQAEDSSGNTSNSSQSVTDSGYDAKDDLWTSITESLPPQWEHVPWGGNMYVNSVTFPFVPAGTQYTYRVVKGTSNLGVRKTYEHNTNGSQTINLLEYNEGYGIIDSTLIKVFATDSATGREFLTVEWNPRNKPISNVQSDYAKEVRKGKLSWSVVAGSRQGSSEGLPRIVSVTLENVPSDTDYQFRVFSGDADLGVHHVGKPKANDSLTIDLKQYNNGEGISSQLPTKVYVIDRDVQGRGTLVAARWPSDTERDFLLAQEDPRVDIQQARQEDRQDVGPVVVDTWSILCFTFNRSRSPKAEKKTGWWRRFWSRF